MQIPTLSTQAPDYGESEALFKTYSYKNGKMEETAYYKSDTVELSDSAIRQSTVPQCSENYNSIVASMKAISPVPANKMFYETADIMNDYYAGKITKEEVKDMYKTFCYSFFGQPDAKMGDAWKDKITRGLSEMYEYFSRANTRAANSSNIEEGKGICDEIGVGRGVSYYNSDYYFACQEMQDFFREISDELSEEYGAKKVDFQYVEENTKFSLDGGITYNGVWEHRNMNANRMGAKEACKMTDTNIVPPKNMIYFSCHLYDKFDLEKLNRVIKGLNKIKDSLKFHSKTLATRHAEDESILLSTIGRDKESPLNIGMDFIRAFAFQHMEERVEYTGIWE